jgi:hypothetical protein
MSSILKALKRLEQQKAERRNMDHDMSWIGRDAGSLARKNRRWPIAAALVAVAGVSVLSTYWFTGGWDSRPLPAPPATEGSTRPGVGSRWDLEAPPINPLPPGPATPPSSPSGPGPAEVSPVPGKISSVPSRAVREIPSLNDDGAPPDAAVVSVREELVRTPRQSVTRRPPEPAASRSVASAAMPRLSVTGIAWQNDGTVHYAVVNGQSVSEGSMVDGARVEKIFPDRVSFSCQNRSFEVSLSQ